MFKSGKSKLVPVLALCSLMAACVHVERSSSEPDRSIVVKTVGGACQASNGPVADGTVIYRCSQPNAGVANCPQYMCQRCNNGTWGGEYACQMR
jgi:hypothetical protein